LAPFEEGHGRAPRKPLMPLAFRKRAKMAKPGRVGHLGCGRRTRQRPRLAVLAKRERFLAKIVLEHIMNKPRKYPNVI
jgi:hypothetical protein